jgi:hypothetical protein
MATRPARHHCQAPPVSSGFAAQRQETRLPGVQQLRQQERREQKLEDIREQIAQGKLVIREMTAEERRRYPQRAVTRRAKKRYL